MENQGFLESFLQTNREFGPNLDDVQKGCWISWNSETRHQPAQLERPLWKSELENLNVWWWNTIKPITWFNQPSNLHVWFRLMLWSYWFFCWRLDVWGPIPLVLLLQNHSIPRSETHEIMNWLVVGPPLWKIWKSIGMIRNPILMGK